MRVIENTTDLEVWLDENYSFEDGYIPEITTHKDKNNVIDSVEIRLGYQVEGTFQGGTPTTLKEYILKATNIKLWTFNESTTYYQDHCIEGLDSIKNCDGIGIEFDVPELVKLICTKIIVEGPFLKKSTCKPWVSDREIVFYVKDSGIPKPSEWIKWLNELEFDVSWRYGGGEAKDPQEVPYPDYSGWFLQETYKIPDTQFGVFLYHVGLNKENVALHLSKYDDGIDELWRAITTIFALKPQVEILSGNCRFSGTQWIEYLNSNVIPDNMYDW